MGKARARIEDLGEDQLWRHKVRLQFKREKEGNGAGGLLKEQREERPSVLRRAEMLDGERRRGAVDRGATASNWRNRAVRAATSGRGQASVEFPCDRGLTARLSKFAGSSGQEGHQDGASPADGGHMAQKCSALPGEN